MWLPIGLLASLVFASACGATTPAAGGGGAPARETAGEPRAFRMGFSALPAILTDDGYTAAFDLAAKHGEVLLIQRAPVWAEFIAGATPSARTRTQTITERDTAAARGLKLFVALDPFDPADRGRLAGLPPGREGRDLSDRELHNAFVAEAKYIAVNYRPAYLALGVEVNATYERNPTQYARFVAAYREAYSTAKAASPDTLIFPTFEYEQLLGVIPWEAPHPPRWELVKDFADRSDLFGIATYPSFAYAVARKVPPNYYRQAKAHTTLPVAFVSVGYASDMGRDGVNSSTPPEQRRFLQRLIGEADTTASPLVIWFAGRDAGYLATPPFDLFAAIGLRDKNDQPKEAWPVWEQAAKRPYDSSTPPKPQDTSPNGESPAP